MDREPNCLYGGSDSFLENEKVYDRDAGDTIPLSNMHQLGKALGSRVADMGNGVHHESAVESCDTLVESTDPDPLDLSRDQIHMEEETVVVTRRVDPERGKSTVNGENRMLMEVVDPEPLTGDHVPFRKETGKSEFIEGERGGCGKRETVSVKRGFLRGKEIDMG